MTTPKYCECEKPEPRTDVNHSIEDVEVSCEKCGLPIAPMKDVMERVEKQIGNAVRRLGSETPSGDKSFIKVNPDEFKDMKFDVKVVPSPRIDYCVECDAEHGYDCPKDAPTPSESWGEEFERRFVNPRTGLILNGSETAGVLKSFISRLLSSVRESTLREVEAEMLDKIYYIGSELPQVKDDVRDKFVLLGYPQKFLDDVRERLSKLRSTNN